MALWIGRPVLPGAEPDAPRSMHSEYPFNVASTEPALRNSSTMETRG